MTQEELLRAMLIKHTAIEFPDVSREVIAALVDSVLRKRRQSA